MYYHYPVRTDGHRCTMWFRFVCHNTRYCVLLLYYCRFRGTGFQTDRVETADLFCNRFEIRCVRTCNTRLRVTPNTRTRSNPTAKTSVPEIVTAVAHFAGCAGSIRLYSRISGNTVWVRYTSIRTCSRFQPQHITLMFFTSISIKLINDRFKNQSWKTCHGAVYVKEIKKKKIHWTD